MNLIKKSLRPSRLKNESGAILILVAVLSLVMMIIALGIISLNASQAISHEHQVDRVKASQLAKGIWWLQYSNQFLGGNAADGIETIDGKPYTFNIIADPIADSGPNETETFTVQIQY